MTFKLTPSATSLKEGDSGIRTITFDVEWTGSLPKSVPSDAKEVEISLRIATGDTALSDGVVFGDTNTQFDTLTLKVENGKVAKGTFTVTVNGDTEQESDETFSVNISQSTWRAEDHHGTLGIQKQLPETASQKIVILDDDTPPDNIAHAVNPNYDLGGGLVVTPDLTLPDTSVVKTGYWFSEIAGPVKTDVALGQGDTGALDTATFDPTPAKDLGVLETIASLDIGKVAALSAFLAPPATVSAAGAGSATETAPNTAPNAGADTFDFGPAKPSLPEVDPPVTPAAEPDFGFDEPQMEPPSLGDPITLPPELAHLQDQFDLPIN